MLTVLYPPYLHNCRIAYIDFRSQADAERTLEEKQGTEIGGLAILLEHVGEKNQGQEARARKNRSRRGKHAKAL